MNMVEVDDEFSMNPEMISVANIYLQTTDVAETAQELGIPKEKVVYYLNKPEVKRYIDTIFLEQGYISRTKIAATLSDVIEKKILEMEETELGSTKDIAELLALAHKIRMDELKHTAVLEAPKIDKQQNIQINNSFGDNYNSLLEKILK